VDQIDPLQPHTHQQQDFNPGIAPSGLLWTVRIPDDDVEVDGEDLDDGASMSIKRLSLGDYGTLANALFTHATEPVPAVVSLVRKHWRHQRRRSRSQSLQLQGNLHARHPCLVRQHPKHELRIPVGLGPHVA